MNLCLKRGIKLTILLSRSEFGIRFLSYSCLEGGMQWKFVYEALCLAVELCVEYMFPQVQWKQRSFGATTVRIDSL